MPIACRNKLLYGKTYCVTDCPTRAENSPLEYVRVTEPADLPPAHPRVIDVPILDMNYGWPNLGHDSIVHAVMDAGCDLIPQLFEAGLSIRVLSFEVRLHRMIPVGPGRYSLYLGTGGPGHIDPHFNDGGEGSQGIHEDPSWEPELFRLFDAIRDHEDAALVSVCHTFGVMCRWAGVAQPVLRPAEKGGKSVGLLENALTPDAQSHPWFGQLADELPDRRRLRIVDHRLFDLIQEPGELPRGFTALGHETLGIGGPVGAALTMMEFARDAGGIMPRILGVNHHPEIVDRSRQLMILRQKLSRGEITEEFFEDRTRTLAETYPEDGTDQRLHLTSDFTLLGPLRFHLYRQVRLRAEALGRDVDVDERRIAEGVRS
jgi:hypothetical protein